MFHLYTVATVAHLFAAAARGLSRRREGVLLAFRPRFGNITFFMQKRLFQPGSCSRYLVDCS